MFTYTIIKTTKNSSDISFTTITQYSQDITPINYFMEYFTHWYAYKNIKQDTLNSLKTYYAFSYNNTCMLLDLPHETLYFFLESDYVDTEHALPFEITDYYSEETTEERLAHYMIKNNLIGFVCMKFKNFCELCDAWDQIYINTPNYIVLYQTASDAEILLATFDTEQEALHFVKDTNI